jgi:hypothetical protein
MPPSTPLTLFPKSAEYLFGGYLEILRCVSPGIVNFIPAGRVGSRSTVPLACGLARESGYVGGR